MTPGATFDEADSLIRIEARLELTAATEALAALSAFCARGTPAAPITVELTGETPMPAALQLAAAARRSLVARDAFAGFGAAARRALDA